MTLVLLNVHSRQFRKSYLWQPKFTLLAYDNSKSFQSNVRRKYFLTVVRKQRHLGKQQNTLENNEVSSLFMPEKHNKNIL